MKAMERDEGRGHAARKLLVEAENSGLDLAERVFRPAARTVYAPG